MQFSVILIVILAVFAGSAVQGALGFGTTMITLGFLPLIMSYGKAMGRSIVMVTISTIFVSFKYLLLGIMFVVVSVFSFVFSKRIRIRPTPVTGTFLGIICRICYGLFATGGRGRDGSRNDVRSFDPQEDSCRGVRKGDLRLCRHRRLMDHYQPPDVRGQARLNPLNAHCCDELI